MRKKREVVIIREETVNFVRGCSVFMETQYGNFKIKLFGDLCNFLTNLLSIFLGILENFYILLHFRTKRFSFKNS